MRTSLRVGMLGVALALLATTGASATIHTVTDGNSSISVDDSSQAGMLSWTVDGVDHMAQQWFWFRTSSTSPEGSLDTLPLISAASAGNSISLSYGANNFFVDIQYDLDGSVPGESFVLETVSFTNIGGSPIDLTWFEYTDFDLNGTAIDEAAEAFDFFGLSIIAQFDGALLGAVAAENVSHFEIAAVLTILNSLNDGAPTTLSDGVNPFVGPANIAHAFQFEFTINPDDTVGYEKLKLVSTIPEPASLVLLAVGIAAVAVRRRRR